MLKDRVYGIRETLFHDPYYQRHVVGAPLVRAASAGRIESEANYAVFRTKLDGADARSSTSAATSTSSSHTPTASSSRAAPSSTTAR